VKGRGREEEELEVLVERKKIGKTGGSRGRGNGEMRRGKGGMQPTERTGKSCETAGGTVRKKI